MTIDTALSNHLIQKANAERPRLAAEILNTASRIASNLAARLEAANSFRDSDMTPDGVNKRRQAMTDRAISSARDLVAAQVAAARSEAAAAEAAIAAHQIRPNPNDVAELTRTGQMWETLVKPMRDRGTHWNDIAAQMDADGIKTLRRFAPAIINTTESEGDAPIILGNLERAIERRTADILTDESGRAAFTSTITARPVLAAAQEALQRVDGIYSISGAAAAQIGIKRAAFAVGVPLTPPVTGAQEQAAAVE